MFLHIKKHLAGKKFDDDDEVQEVMTWFKELTADFYDSGIQKLVPSLNKCLDNAGDYVEKQSYVQAIHSQCRFCKLEMYMFKNFVSLLSGYASYIISVPVFTHRYTFFHAVKCGNPVSIRSTSSFRVWFCKSGRSWVNLVSLS